MFLCELGTGYWVTWVLLKYLGSAGSRVEPQVSPAELHLHLQRVLQVLCMVCVQESSEKPAKRENPHKYLLYKPTFSQLFTFLSASFKVSLSLDNQDQVLHRLVLAFYTWVC